MMTERELLTWVVENGTNEAKEKASDMIVKMDTANEKRKAKNAEKAAERQPLIDAAVALLGSTPKTASDLKDALGMSVQKTSSLLRAAVAQGSAKVEDVKGTKGTVKGYSLV